MAEKTNDQLKAELDTLGVEYPADATKEVLKALLAGAKSVAASPAVMSEVDDMEEEEPPTPAKEAVVLKTCHRRSAASIGENITGVLFYDGHVDVASTSGGWHTLSEGGFVREDCLKVEQ